MQQYQCPTSVCSYPANSQMEMYNRLTEFVSVFSFTWNYLNNLQISFLVSLIRFYLLLYVYLKEGTVIKMLQEQPVPFSRLHNFLLTIFLQRVKNTLFNALKLHFSNGNTAWSCFAIISKAAQSIEQSVRWAVQVPYCCHVLTSNFDIHGSYSHKDLNLLCWVFWDSAGYIFKTDLIA